MTSNIMIIDDSPIDRRIIRKVLENRLEDIQIFEMEEGINLNKNLSSKNIHMCILDIMMPIKDGFQVLQELKEDLFLMDIPVIVCTGIEDKKAIEKALTLGAYDYFSKPLSEEAMKISLPLKVKNAIHLMKRNEGISYLSYHDILTGLYNRRFYEEQIRRLNTEKHLPISIIMADINGLKLVNDAFGHAKGDNLLKVAATAIQGMCRMDDIVARWGGDEFIILLPNTKKEEAEAVVARIKNLYSDKEVNGVNLSISFGWDTKESIHEDIMEVLKNAEDNMYRNKTIENESVRSNMIQTILTTLYEKNPREETHAKRVSEISQVIGRAMGLSEIEVGKLVVGSLLHDIGKIAVEESVINNSGALTAQEWGEMKRHPEIGYRILSSSHEMLELTECILYHHERWDGTGYPKGLKGEDIPRNARIIALADSYDAMTGERLYRQPASPEMVIEEIQRNAGIQFDPEIAQVFIDKVLKRGYHFESSEC